MTEAGAKAPVFTVKARKLSLGLAGIALGLTLVGVVAMLTGVSLPPSSLPFKLLALLDLNGEATVPAWYSAFLWALASLLALGIGVQGAALREPLANRWQGFSSFYLWMKPVRSMNA